MMLIQQQQHQESDLQSLAAADNKSIFHNQQQEYYGIKLEQQRKEEADNMMIASSRCCSINYNNHSQQHEIGKQFLFDNHQQHHKVNTTAKIPLSYSLLTDSAAAAVVVNAEQGIQELKPKMSNKRGSLQLWQFLLHLLNSKESETMIEWTRKSAAEFKLLDPEEVARRWGLQKNRPTMNYDKLSRSLRYYYEKGIMQKVSGERYVYRFINHKELNNHELISASKSLMKNIDTLKCQPSSSSSSLTNGKVHAKHIKAESNNGMVVKPKLKTMSNNNNNKINESIKYAPYLTPQRAFSSPSSSAAWPNKSNQQQQHSQYNQSNYPKLMYQQQHQHQQSGSLYLPTNSYYTHLISESSSSQSENNYVSQHNNKHNSYNTTSDSIDLSSSSNDQHSIVYNNQLFNTTSSSSESYNHNQHYGSSSSPLSNTNLAASVQSCSTPNISNYLRYNSAYSSNGDLFNGHQQQQQVNHATNGGSYPISYYQMVSPCSSTGGGGKDISSIDLVKHQEISPTTTATATTTNNIASNQFMIHPSALNVTPPYDVTNYSGSNFARTATSATSYGDNIYNSSPISSIVDNAAAKYGKLYQQYGQSTMLSNNYVPQQQHQLNSYNRSSAASSGSSKFQLPLSPSSTASLSASSSSSSSSSSTSSSYGYPSSQLSDSSSDFQLHQQQHQNQHQQQQQSASVSSSNYY